MKNTSHPPTRRAALARTGDVCPLAPATADSLSLILHDIQAALPSQGRPPVAAVLDACIARIIDLLLAVLARLATGQPRVAAPPATTAVPASSAPPSFARAALAHARAISRPHRSRNPRRPHAPPAPINARGAKRHARPTARLHPHPDGIPAVVIRPPASHPRRRTAASRAPPPPKHPLPAHPPARP